MDGAAEVGKDFNKLVDLMLRDKVVSACNSNLVAFFEERKPKDIDTMSQLGQNYMTAHPNSIYWETNE